MPNDKNAKRAQPQADVLAGAGSVAQLKAIMDNVNGGVTAIVYDKGGNVKREYRNKRYFDMFGYTAEQFAAELDTPYAIVVPEDADRVRETIRRICETGQPAAFLYRARTRDGNVINISCRSSLVSIEGLNEKIVLSIMADVTSAVTNERRAQVAGQRLNAILSHISSGVVACLLHEDGNVEYVFVSDRYYEMLGYTREIYRREVSDPFSLIHKDEEAEVRRIAAAMREPGDSATLKYRAIRRDGRVIWLKVDISIMRFMDVDSPVMLSVFEDITQSVEVEGQLHLQEARIVKLMNETPGGIAVIEADRRDVKGTLKIVYYNDSFYRFSGCSREEYAANLLQNRMGFIYDEDIDSIINVAVQVCSGELGTTGSGVARCATKAGGYRWLLLTGQLVERRNDICTINIVQVDITPRKDAEDRLRVNEEMLRIAAETDRRALVTYDIKKNICHVGSNSLFSAKYGESFANVPDSLLKKGVVAAESVSELRSMFDRIRLGESSITVSLRMYTGRDEYQWFECNATTVFDADGKPDKAVLVLHNITDQLLKEAVFKRWQKSIDTRPPESYTLFRCNISKDANIDQRNGELLKIQFSEDAMTFADRTREYAERYVYPDDRAVYMALLNSDSLLAMYYRGEHETFIDYREIIDSGEIRWRRLSVELVEYLNSTDIQAFLLYEDINDKKLAEIKAKEEAESDPLTGAINRIAFAEKIETVIYKEPGRQHALLMIDMDGFKLLNDRFGHSVGDQALIDTVATLRSLIRDGDYVCRLGGDEFLVWLHDIPYDAAIGKVARQICDQVRMAYSREVQVTASIGVAVYPRDGGDFDGLYRNADKALYKVKNAGKDNYALFSSGADDDKDDARDDSVKAKAPAAKPKRRMLIAEDDEISRELLSEIFKDEYIIETAKNGNDAMIRIRHFGSAISVVLLDLLMPKMDGFEVLKRMQNNAELQAIPVIVVSGDTHYETLLKAIESGAADYVTKPVDANLIRIRVKSAVSKAENERLRAQNSYLQLQRTEEVKFHTVLESTGTVVVEYDWRNHVFIYDNTISKHIAGNFENRSLWTVFMTDMVADTSDVKSMQEMLLALANDRERSSESKMVVLKTPNRQKHWFRVNVYKQVDDFGLAEKMIITFNDVHEEVLANEKLKFQATRDELTGLYNRAGFIEKAAELISAHDAGYYVLAVADIEKFKVINDQYGTAKGDEVLRGFANVIGELQEGGESVCCRVMADSFAMLYPLRLLDKGMLDDMHSAAEILDGSLPRLKIYVGRLIVDDKSLSVSLLLDRATIAKDTVKGRYDEHIAVYDESMRTGILRQQSIISQMNSALKNGQFEVWFQPQYHHGEGALSGAEALVRWRHNTDGLIPPAEFIPIFERNGFVYELDKYVWEQTCKALRSWLDCGISPVPVSVNVSRYDVFREDLIDVITGLVRKYRLPADMLRLEITESAFSKSAEQIIEVVRRLIDSGFTVEIDDFGSGYSSLNTLKDVPAQTLKMDMRFFENSRNSKRGGNIIESVVRMAKWLGMSVIAEGVEDKDQADYLESVGCSYIQGYYYAKPMPARDYEALLCRADKNRQRKALETLETLDNNEFWNPKSMETLVFNSYIGGACVFELHNGVAEVLRQNKEYEQIFSGGFAYDFTRAGTKTLGFMDDSDRTRLMDNVWEAITSGKASTCEVCLVSASAEKKHLRVTVRLIARADDRYLLYCVLADITEQRVAEIKEHDMAVQLKTIMENIHGGITATIFHDKNNVEIVFTNDGFYDMFGYTKEQLEAELDNLLDLILPEDREKTMETVERIVRERGTATYEYRCRKRNGSIIWVQVTNTVIDHNSLGNTVLLAASSDVTELRRAQENELESIERLRTVMDHAGNGITAVTMEASGPRLLFVNDKFFEIVGYTKEGYEELSHGDMFNVVHPDERESTRERVMAVRNPGERETIDYRIVRQDGSEAWVRAIVTITKLTGVDAPVQIAVFSDITVEKEASAQLRFLNESAREILAQPDSEQAINETLERLVEYFGADRGYVVELDNASMTSRNTYERCASGVAGQMSGLQDVPFSASDFWYASLISKNYYILESIDLLDSAQRELRDMLEKQGIRSMILAPLWRDGSLIGFAGVDNPSKAVSQTERLTALSDYIAVLLTRRDLSRRIERDAEMLRDLPVRLLDHLPNGAALYRFKGGSLTAVHINKRYWELVGREPTEYGKASVLGVIHPDDREIAYQEIESAIRQQRVAMVDIRILGGNGQYRPFHVVANISREADGSYMLFTSYTPKSEQGMSIQEMIPIAISTMMSTSSNISYVKDKDMRFICCSKSLANLTGFESERDIIGKSARDLFDEKNAARFDKDDRSVIASGKAIVDAPEHIPGANGRVYMAKTSKYPLLDASGNAVGVYCLSIDVTAQREKESQLELLLNSIPGGLASYLCAPDGIRLSYCNSGFLKLFGLTREEYEAGSADDPLKYVFEQDRATLIAQYHALMNGGPAIDCAYRVHVNGGGYKWIHHSGQIAQRSENALLINAVLLDITEQQEAQERLRVSEELNRLAIEHSGSIITRFDVRARTLTLPESFTPIYEVPRVLYNMPDEQIALGRVSPETAKAYTELFESIARGEPSGSAVYQQNSTKGWRWLDAQFTTVFSNSGEPVSAVISFSDITERLEKEVVYNKWQQSLTARPEDSYALFRCNLSRGASYDSWEGKLLTVDFDARRQSFAERTLEYASQCVCEDDRDEYVSFLNPDRLLAEYHRGRPSGVIEYRERMKDGNARWLKLTVDLVEYPNSNDIEAYLMYENIDEQKRADLITLERSETDPLTGVLNRTTFISRMEKTLRESKQGERHALYMLDVDDFKKVNDTMGHSVGDRLLCELTKKIGTILRRDDLIGRLGGDEFFVFLIGIPDRDAAEKKARQICALEFFPDDTHKPVTASIGIAMIPDDGTDFDTLYKKVDAALYSRKKLGKNGFLFAE